MDDILRGAADAALLYCGYKLYPWRRAPKRLGDDRTVGPPYTHDVRRGARLLRHMRRH